MVETRGCPRGLTLVELLIVLVILVAVASIALPLFGGVAERASEETTVASLERLRLAIVGGRDQPGFLVDTGRAPRDLADLFVRPTDGSFLPSHRQSFDPVTGFGWRGPYIANPSARYAVDAANGFAADYGSDGDPGVLDGWGRPIVLQYPTTGTTADNSLYVRLVSAGPDGRIDTPQDLLAPGDDAVGDGELTIDACDDDLVRFVHVADTRE